jgi:hypothetical protein
MPPVDFTADIHERLAAAEAALHAVGQQISPAIRHLDIAVLIPCCNESAAIGDVVKSFKVALPHARIFVYDNNSHDNTATVARESGAIVRREPLQGKGNVIRRMFSDIEADVYLMVDGDATYDAASAPRLVSRLIETQADMVVGARITEDKAAFRAGHHLGSRILAGLVTGIYGDRSTDLFSGYRAFSRRFAKSYPAIASSTGVEAELTLHALDLGMITVEVQTPYAARRVRPTSTLATIKSELRALGMAGGLMRDKRPLLSFGALAAATVAGALVLAGAAISGMLAVLAGVSLLAGLIFETINVGRREAKRLAYNEIESLAAKLERLEETRLTLTSLRAQVLSDNPAVAAAPYGLRKRRTH